MLFAHKLLDTCHHRSDQAWDYGVVRPAAGGQQRGDPPWHQGSGAAGLGAQPSGED
eukprot:SAG22_NODE_789_length_7224_cov_2.663953_1_plen_56_part_00